MKEWRRNLRNNPKRYAITSAIFYTLWMTAFFLGSDRIRHQRISVVSVMIALIICSFGGVFIGCWTYRRRMQERNEGGIEELVRQYETEQADITPPSVESTRTQ